MGRLCCQSAGFVSENAQRTSVKYDIDVLHHKLSGEEFNLVHISPKYLLKVTRSSNVNALLL
jgi:hypothetical protein